ncbi:DUF1489 family protein [Commensalibacter oyaizuii]|uniref:DUF1489 domain-containing protein n=1 Tax=Commensalibacter oyaizuii TaxID=3043873 RepID=A0ABT6Q4R9_9PROT|nr:DUF1489 domain-containing protein [Commensalibacter sp. TBRC 16381]MDI2091556.1 DUF1489 domain-containing protein [Commensalibacter sp. TBRC 16381]
MLHIMKVAVGVQDIEHLLEINRSLAKENGGYPYTLTRFPPKQIADILDQGSLYRVIKGIMCCRQIIKDFIPSTRENGSPCIKILLEPEIIRTHSIPIKPFQGWRYLKPETAPADLSRNNIISRTNLPLKMKQDLKELGLIDY